MSNNPIIIYRNDSAPEVVYELIDNSTKQPINLHSNTVEVWLKFAKMNNSNTLYMIRGEKPNGGFDGQCKFSHTDPSDNTSLLENLTPARYQGEIFISNNTYNIGVSSVDSSGLFTSATDHNLSNGEKIWFTGVSESDLNETIGNKEFTVTVVSSTTFTLQESWSLPSSTVNFAAAFFYNVSETETSIEVSPYNIKGDFTP